MGGEDYLGLSPPFVILPPVIHHTCSYVIANAIFASDPGATSPGNISYAYPSISITPTLGLPAIVFGAILTNGSSSPSWTVGAGYTSLGYGPSAYGLFPCFGAMYQAIPNPSGVYTPNGVIGRGSLNPWDSLPTYRMIAVSIYSPSTSPIQSGFTLFSVTANPPQIVLAPPTLGNFIVMIASSRDADFGPIFPTTGWTKITNPTPIVYNGGADSHIGMWIRCANPADGNNYGFSPTSLGYSISVSEWTP